MTRTVPIIALLLLVGWAAPMGDAQIDSRSIVQVGGDVVINWTTRVEVDVVHYVVERRAPYAGTFEKVSEIPAHGINQAYEFRDRSVYKGSSEKFDYRLSAVFANEVRKDFPIFSISYTPTAVRRTWGSIKAMFQ